MGIAPPHFMRSYAATDPPIFPYNNACNTLWSRHAWQDVGQVSHEDLAYLISAAEDDVAGIIGYYPAPKWINEENHNYPRPFRSEQRGVGLNIRGRLKGVDAHFGKFIQGGRRAVSIIDTPTVVGGELVYTDDDLDGMFETATITVPTTLTDVNEIKVYVEGMDGDPEWEIRPIRQKTITGGNCVIVLDAWWMLDPEIFAQYPSVELVPVFDLSNVDDLVTTVDVYREYTDTTQASAVFQWESTYDELCSCGGSGCSVCSQYTQDGCLSARDQENSYLIPYPATYDADAGTWDKLTCNPCPEPEMVKIWYYAGEIDNIYRAGRTFDPLSDFWAQTIAWIATARVGRPLCDCSSVHNFAEVLREDVTLSTRDSSHFVSRDDLSNPLGTHYGEILAWRRIKHAVPKKFKALVV